MLYSFAHLGYYVKNAVNWSEQLDEVFISNLKIDPTMSWQYFGSSTGFMRQYPGECILFIIIIFTFYD